MRLLTLIKILNRCFKQCMKRILSSIKRQVNKNNLLLMQQTNILTLWKLVSKPKKQLRSWKLTTNIALSKFKTTLKNVVCSFSSVKNKYAQKRKKQIIFVHNSMFMKKQQLLKMKLKQMMVVTTVLQSITENIYLVRLKLLTHMILRKQHWVRTKRTIHQNNYRRSQMIKVNRLIHYVSVLQTANMSWKIIKICRKRNLLDFRKS